jgi:hypothetical protein
MRQSNDASAPKAFRILIIGINYAPEMISTGVYATGTVEFSEQ